MCVCVCAFFFFFLRGEGVQGGVGGGITKNCFHNSNDGSLEVHCNNIYNVY